MNNLVKDIKLILCNKKLLICLVCFIIAICVITGTYRYNSNETKTVIRIGIANNDDSQYSQLLLNFFKSNESFNNLAEIIEDSNRVIESGFHAGEIDAYIVIPDGFVDALMDLEDMRIKVRINQDKEVEAIVLKAILKSYEKYVTSVQNNAVGLYKSFKKSGLTIQESRRLNLLTSLEMVNMALAKEMYFDYKIVEQKKVGIIEHYTFTLLYVIIIYYGIYVGVQIKKEQAIGVFKLYKVSGCNMLGFVVSKILVNSMILIALLIAPCFMIAKMLGGIFTINMFIYVVNNIIMYISLMLLLAVCIISKNTYILVSNALALIILVISGGIIPTAYMPDNLQGIIRYMPLKSYVENMTNEVYDSIASVNIKYSDIINNTQIMDETKVIFVITCLVILISVIVLERSSKVEQY